MTQKWFYNFDSVQVFKALTPLLIESLETAVDDPAKIGKRLISRVPTGKQIERAPLWLPKIKVLLHDFDFLPTAQNSLPHPGLIIDGPPSNRTWKFDPTKSILKELAALSKHNKLFKVNNNLKAVAVGPIRKLFSGLSKSEIGNLDLSSLQFRADRLLSLKRLLLEISDDPCRHGEPLKSPREVVGLKPHSNEDSEDNGEGVKIAVIDSDFNFDDSPLKVEEYFDFAPNEPANGASKRSHGTNSLSIISGSRNSIAPRAKIYLARIGSNPSHSGAMSAITWAMSKEVDIISMSFDLARNSIAPYAWLDRLMLQRPDTLCVVACGVNNVNVFASALAVSTKCISVNGLKKGGYLWFRAREDDKLARVDCVSIGDFIESKNVLREEAFVPHCGVSAATPLVSGALAIYAQRTRFRGERLKAEFIMHCCKPLAEHVGRDRGNGEVSLS